MQKAKITALSREAFKVKELGIFEGYDINSDETIGVDVGVCCWTKVEVIKTAQKLVIRRNEALVLSKGIFCYRIKP